MSRYLKPRTFAEALQVAAPTQTADPKYREFFYRGGADDPYNTYRGQVLEHLKKLTKLQFLKQDFLADMQNKTDVDKWLGHIDRSTKPTVMCVYNALCNVQKNQLDPSPRGEKFTWEVDYILRTAFGRDVMVNTTKLFTLHAAIDEVKRNGGTYLAVLFRQDVPNAAGPKVPKKSVVAGGISHMQVWRGPGHDKDFEIEDPQSGKQEWVKGDKRVVLWKIAEP